MVVAESLRPVLDEAVQRLGGGAPRVLTAEEYERLLEGARPAELRLPADERALLSMSTETVHGPRLSPPTSYARFARDGEEAAWTIGGP